MQIFASALLAAAMAAQAAVATPIRARTPYEVKETHFAPREWSKMERANGGKMVQLQIGLKQGNMVGKLTPRNMSFGPIGLTIANRMGLLSISTRVSSIT